MIETSWNNKILKITTKTILYSSILSIFKFNKCIYHLIITVFVQSDKNNSIKPLMCAGVEIII